MQVNTHAGGHWRQRRGERRQHGPAHLAGELHRCLGLPDRPPFSIVVAIAVEEQVEAGAGPDLDQRQRPAPGQAGHRGKGRQQHGAAPWLIGLDQPCGHQFEQGLAVVAAEGAEGRQQVL
jgi:hypothetical protein